MALHRLSSYRFTSKYSTARSLTVIDGLFVKALEIEFAYASIQILDSKTFIAAKMKIIISNFPRGM